MVELTKEAIQEIVRETVNTMQVSADPCTIWNLFESHCELNNNVTIMVELAVGGGLAAFLYWMQHKSSKKQKQVWESNRLRLYREYWDIFNQLTNYYMHNNPKEKIVYGGKIKRTRRPVSINILSILYGRLEASVHDDKEFIDSELIEMITLFVELGELGPFDAFLMDQNITDRHLTKTLGLIDKVLHPKVKKRFSFLHKRSS